MLQEKFVRFQLSLFKPFASTCSLEAAREGQDKLGALLASLSKNDVVYRDIRLLECDASMITPKDELSGGIVLYLHGGGYTCGDIKYAKGFGTTLAAKCGIRVFCTAYRLAPEHVFPAAVDDALAAYDYLLSLGYAPRDIILCGESAGGGLIYSLCLKLKELGRKLPAGLIGISPWTDLTLSGATYASNRDADPSMTRERLKYYADCYVHGSSAGIEDAAADSAAKSDPLVSPLFGELSGLPHSLLFAGGDEILLDDARMLHDRLLAAGCDSRLIVRERMWHGYVLFCLKENEGDFETIYKFIREIFPRQKKLRWMKLDNAAKIYPAIKTRQWNNFFRLSMTLDEEIDRGVLKSALDVTVRRFPSIAVRLRRGVFWYYLEEIPRAPVIMEESDCPLAWRPFDNIRKCALRVIVYKNRIAVELFHAVTDGNGGLVFIKTLVAEYLSQKYGREIPAEYGILDRLEIPKEAEFEDSFLKNSGNIGGGQHEANAFRFRGTPEPDAFCTNTTLMFNAHKVAAEAKKRGVTVTAFLAAALIKATINVQEQTVHNPMRRRFVKVLIPVNLRRIFGSKTLRNFVLYDITGVDVRLGDYSLDELCSIVHHQMGMDITEKQMRLRITANVGIERSPLLKIMPLWIKNIAMKMAFNVVGERKSCFSFSNLGIVQMPQEMEKHINRVDFVLGVQQRAPYNVGALTYGDTMYISFIRNIKEPLLEKSFYEVLRGAGLSAKAESNQRD